MPSIFHSTQTGSRQPHIALAVSSQLQLTRNLPHSSSRCHEVKSRVLPSARTMTLPDPAYSFTIPSLHDDTPLDCRIYHPSELAGSASSVEDTWQKKGAIIAHPYAPLGGSYDDPIVSVVGQEVLRQGFIVGTFNFRYGTWKLSSTRRADTSL